MRRNRLSWFEIVVFLIMVAWLMVHIVYRNTIENTGTLVFNDHGVAFLVREEGVSREYERKGYITMPFHSNQFNSLELFDENLRPVSRIIIDGYENATDKMYADMRDYVKEKVTHDTGTFTVSSNHGNVSVQYGWCHASDGRRYLVVITVSEYKIVWLAIDTLLNYGIFIAVMILIIHSMWRNSKLNSYRYRKMMFDRASQDDAI